jgi:hypothetical protein
VASKSTSKVSLPTRVLQLAKPSYRGPSVSELPLGVKQSTSIFGVWRSFAYNADAAFSLFQNLPTDVAARYNKAINEAKAEEGRGYKTKPIADLFFETTLPRKVWLLCLEMCKGLMVLLTFHAKCLHFGDIMGFVAWS